VSDFTEQLRAAEASRALADLEARTEGRAMTRDERRLAARYLSRTTTPAGASAPASHTQESRWTK